MMRFQRGKPVPLFFRKIVTGAPAARPNASPSRSPRRSIATTNNQVDSTVVVAARRIGEFLPYTSGISPTRPAIQIDAVEAKKIEADHKLKRLLDLRRGRLSRGSSATLGADLEELLRDRYLVLPAPIEYVDRLVTAMFASGVSLKSRVFVIGFLIVNKASPLFLTILVASETFQAQFKVLWTSQIEHLRNTNEATDILLLLEVRHLYPTRFFTVAADLES